MFIAVLAGSVIVLSLILVIPMSTTDSVLKASTTLPRKLLGEPTPVAPSPVRVKVSSRSNAPSILFVISTTAKNYATRVVAIQNTWLKRVEEKPSMDIMFVGDPDQAEFPHLVRSGCKVGYWEDACKRAEMLTFAYNYLNSPKGEFIDWVYFADDDVYIFPDNLQRMIMSLGSPAVHTSQVWAIPGCASGKCNGICGGGGYFTNRETVAVIQEKRDRNKYPNLSDETSIYDKECGRYGDLALSRVIKDHRGIPIKKYPGGSFTWAFDKGDEGLIASLQSRVLRPWFYHYPARDRMDFIHQKGLEFHTNWLLHEKPTSGQHSQHYSSIS